MNGQDAKANKMEGLGTTTAASSEPEDANAQIPQGNGCGSNPDPAVGVKGRKSQIPRPIAPETMDDDEETGRRWALYALQVQRYIYAKGKGSRKDFGDFIVYYNKHRQDLNLTSDQTAALKRLHSMWKSISQDTELDFYFEMKKEHEWLNGRFLFGITGQINAEYRNYITNFMGWRSGAGLLRFQVAKYYMHKQRQEGANGNVRDAGTRSA